MIPTGYKPLSHNEDGDIEKYLDAYTLAIGYSGKRRTLLIFESIMNAILIICIILLAFYGRNA